MIATRQNSTTSRRWLAVLAILAALAPPAWADDSGYGFEIIPLGGYVFGGEFSEADGDADVELDDAAGFGFILGGVDTRRTQWEIYYNRQATAGDTSAVPNLGTSTDITLQTLHLGGSYHGDGERVRPFLSAGIGGSHMSPDAAGLDSDTYWSFSIGTGLEILPSQRVGLRLEARALGTLVDPDGDLFCVSGAGAVCAFRIDGDVLWQLHAFAGVVIRF